jgi:hypothetical protein
MNEFMLLLLLIKLTTLINAWIRENFIPSALKRADVIMIPLPGNCKCVLQFPYKSHPVPGFNF